MKSAPSFALIACLVASAGPVTAQELPKPPGSSNLGGPASQATIGPISHAATREAIRIAAAAEAAPSSGGAVRLGGEAADDDWRLVRKLEPGTEVIVAVQGSTPGQRYFVAADDRGLTLINVDDPSLPRAVTEVLRDVASDHPGYFQAAQRGETLVLGKTVRVARDGVFLADRRVADLGQVVERLARGDVVFIASAAVERNAAGCAFAGYFGGALIGGGPGMLAGGLAGGEGGVLPGMMAGWSIGAVHVYRKCRHKPEEVIYQQ
jgi:hypothetical protein